MAELLKNLYNQKFFDELINAVLKVKPDFEKNSFLDDIYDDKWENRELKQRMRHISIVLNKHLTQRYEENIEIILKTIQQLQSDNYLEESFVHLIFPDFVELNGLDSYETSILAIEKITQFASCEFAVRPFIIKYPEKLIGQMLQWSEHKNAKVRRLATEGCRPRLPWAIALPFLKEDPTPIIPILENLKNDDSETVRRSVANNVNDISKDNPDVVIKLVKSWKGISNETDRLIKHACRTLLKQGNSEVLELFGFGSVEDLKIDNFQIQTPIVKIGDALEFNFQLINASKLDSVVRIEYGVYYQKANGSLAKKVYKISEKEYLKESTTTITRKQSFRLITTRKFHTGLHQISLIINGIELEKKDFELVEA